MDLEARVRQLESVCKAQQQVLDYMMQHISTLIAQANQQGLKLSGATFNVDTHALDVARHF